MNHVEAILRTNLSGARVCSEAELQAWIARVFKAAGVEHDRERSIGEAGRPDFMVGKVAVEVKVGGSRMDLMRQVQRYATSPEVSGVLVVTTRLAHRLPASLSGKPVTTICVTVFGVV